VAFALPGRTLVIRAVADVQRAIHQRVAWPPDVAPVFAEHRFGPRTREEAHRGRHGLVELRLFHSPTVTRATLIPSMPVLFSAGRCGA
jgi:hypothetical protein